MFSTNPARALGLSFDIAAKRLSADTFSITTSTSSMVKGETFLDTVKNLEAMKPDVFVIRHSASGAPHRIAARTSAAVINAGDGMHEHPSQALLDMLTIRDHKGRSRWAHGGHPRRYRSQPRGPIQHLGTHQNGRRVIGCGPPTLIPAELETDGGAASAIRSMR